MPNQNGIGSGPATSGMSGWIHFSSRGIPGRYGGYETLMEELGPRLVARGFRVTVYCRSHVTPPGLRSYRGMDLVVLPPDVNHSGVNFQIERPDGDPAIRFGLAVGAWVVQPNASS